MSNWEQIYYKLLDCLLLNILIKSKSNLTKSMQKIEFDISRPIIYVLPYYSKIDLLTLRTQCLQNNLPDPLEPLKIDGTFLPRYIFIQSKPYTFSCCTTREKSIKLFNNYLDLHRSNLNLDAQIVLISVMFGRRPDYKKCKKNSLIHLINDIQKFFIVPWFGRDSFVYFFPSVSLRRITDKYSNDKIIIQKLIRVARIYSFRYHLAVAGPELPSRRELLKKLLTSKTIIRVIEDEARNKKISHEKAQKNVITLIEEISAKFSYEMIRISEFVLSFFWNRFYHGIHVHNVERVRQLAYGGHKIVYIPCHRSHIDYLLLSYVLYHQRLVPPHIAAGINLNFWPVGSVFRRLGAFFIRRTFKGNKLYSTVFREYLSELFSRGCSIEYFIEGSRSRTGRLLDPKTGTLSMTIQAMLRDSTSSIILVPIYIGYEHVVEIDTYEKELRGATKEKESLLQLLRAIRKLSNLGQGYVNFGKPMQLTTWLNYHIPKWREFTNPIKINRPSWLTPIVNSIASELMIRINNAGSVNAMNLCCTALLASHQYSLTREQLIEQLDCYLSIMRNVSYSAESTIPNVTATKLIDHVLQMDRFEVERNTSGDITIVIPRKQAVLMTYYRNNIFHMLILPSLIATILIHHHWITRYELLRYAKVLYPMLKSELFLGWNENELVIELDKLIIELLRQNLLSIKNDEISSNPARLHTMKLLAAGAREILQRYAITFWLLSTNPLIDLLSLKERSLTLAKRLSSFYDSNTLEFFDKEVFRSLVLTLRAEGYISNTGVSRSYKSLKVYKMLSKIITLDVRSKIENTIFNTENSEFLTKETK